MQKSKDSKNRADRVYEIIYRIILALLGAMLLVALYFGFRIYVGDWFRIPTSSMSPKLIPGDQIIVNKLIAWARIYDEFDFRDSVPMKSHRTRGLRNIERNDIVIFNCPMNRERTKMQFEINYVYGKRYVAIPGDSISIVDGYFRNSNFEGYLGVKSLQDSFLHHKITRQTE